MSSLRHHITRQENESMLQAARRVAAEPKNPEHQHAVKWLERRRPMRRRKRVPA